MIHIKTKPVGVRVPSDLLIRVRAADPEFNLSKFCRDCFVKQFGSVEDKVDLLIGGGDCGL